MTVRAPNDSSRPTGFGNIAREKRSVSRNVHPIRNARHEPVRIRARLEVGDVPKGQKERVLIHGR